MGLFSKVVGKIGDIEVEVFWEDGKSKVVEFVRLKRDYLSVTATFTGLPASYSHFGPKKAEVYIYQNGQNVKMDEASYEVFFPKFQTNHPGAGAGTTKNWYYNWSQTIANNSNTTMIYTAGNRSYYDYSNGRIIVIQDEAEQNQIVVWGSPQGIDTFAWTTAHEAKHHTQLTGFWPVTYYPANDTDWDWPSGDLCTYQQDSSRSPFEIRNSNLACPSPPGNH